MSIDSRRRSAAGLAVAGLLAFCSPPAAQQEPTPFTPEVQDFVAVYLKTGGDKLTNWVQGQTTSPPDEVLRAFLDSTYQAAADLGRWDRPALERAADPRGT